MSEEIKLYVKFPNPSYSSASDVNKSTAAACVSRGLMAEIIEIPDGCILLYPFTDTELTIADKGIAAKYGMCMIDAPWKMLKSINSRISDKVERRVLFYHDNDVHNNLLSTAGAAAYALAIFGETKYAGQIRKLADVMDDPKWIKL